MSATVQQFNFAGKAEDLVAAVQDAGNAIRDAVKLVDEIVEAAAGDDCGGLSRFGFAVEGEARSFAGVIRDANVIENDLASWIRDAHDLQKLIALAIEQIGPQAGPARRSKRPPIPHAT